MRLPCLLLINLCSKLWNISSKLWNTSSKLSNISSKLWNIDYISYREHFLWFNDIVNHSLCNF